MEAEEAPRDNVIATLQTIVSVWRMKIDDLENRTHCFSSRITGFASGYKERFSGKLFTKRMKKKKYLLDE